MFPPKCLCLQSAHQVQCFATHCKCMLLNQTALSYRIILKKGLQYVTGTDVELNYVLFIIVNCSCSVYSVVSTGRNYRPKLVCLLPWAPEIIKCQTLEYNIIFTASSTLTLKPEQWHHVWCFSLVLLSLWMSKDMVILWGKKYKQFHFRDFSPVS